MGETAGVQENTIGLSAGPMKRVDQNALMVALETLDPAPELSPEIREAPVHLVQGDLTIEFRFAGAQHVEVGTVQHQDAMHSGLSRPP